MGNYIEKLNESIASYNSLAINKGHRGLVNYDNGWLSLGTAEQLEYGTYQCLLVERQINELKALEVVKAMQRTLNFN